MKLGNGSVVPGLASVEVGVGPGSLSGSVLDDGGADIHVVVVAMLVCAELTYIELGVLLRASLGRLLARFSIPLGLGSGPSAESRGCKESEGGAEVDEVSE
jgi:hypothetical protein